MPVLSTQCQVGGRGLAWTWGDRLSRGKGGLIQEDTPVGGKQACFPRTFEGHVDHPGKRWRKEEVV